MHRAISNTRNFLSSNNIALDIQVNPLCFSQKETAICNFILNPLRVRKQYSSDGTLCGHIYEFQIFNETQCLVITVSEGDLATAKWIKALKSTFYMVNSAKNYPYILSIFQAMISSSKNHPEPLFENTGFHQINESWIYAASNVCIYADKFCWDKYLLTDHYCLNSSFDNKSVPNNAAAHRIITATIEHLEENMEILMPIFLTATLSTTSSVFAQKNICTPLILWITGVPGCGKTQLATYIGSFFDKSPKRSDANLVYNFIRANEKTGVLTERLKNTRDNVFVLDDVKNDKSTSLREHTETNLDILIRTLYDHNHNGTPVFANAIITGEYRPSMASTLSRIVVLHLKDARITPETFSSLSYFQDRGYLLTDFIILYLQWMCQQLADESFTENLSRQKTDWMVQYRESRYSPRSAETIVTLRLGLYLLESFSTSCFQSSSLPCKKDFWQNCVKVLERLVMHTSLLHEDKPRFLATLLSNLITTCIHVRCVPKVHYQNTLNLFNYCMDENDWCIYINDISVFCKSKESAALLIYRQLLLVRQELLTENLPLFIDAYCLNHHLPPFSFNRHSIISELQKTGILLFSAKRSDGYADNFIEYPTISISNRRCSTGKFYVLNIEHPFFEELRNCLIKQHEQKLPVFEERSEQSLEEYNKKLLKLDNNATTYKNTAEATLPIYNFRRKEYGLDSVEKSFANVLDYHLTKKEER